MNRLTLIGISVVVLASLVGGYFLLSAKNTPSTPTVPEQSQEEVVQSISPEDLGLKTKLREDNKAMKFSISKVDDIVSVEYQISYTKEINGEQVPEALIGEVKVSKVDEKMGIDYREFGTCSRNICRYDKVVSEVKLTLKVSKEDGKVYQSEITVPLQ